MKQCKKCQLLLPLDSFSVKASARDGLQPSCKSCVSAYDKSVYLRNREKRLAQVQSRYSKKSEVVIDYGRQWRRANREKTAAYYAANEVKIKVAAKLRRESRLAEFRERERQYALRNTGKINAKCAKRRASRLERTVGWANMAIIRFFYVTRCWISIETGERWHVDHIVPLLGRYVSGLHTHTNLAVIPALANQTKFNKFSQ